MYKVEIHKNVLKKDMKKLPPNIRKAVIKKIEELEKNPRPNGYKALKGHQNTFRIRVGSYRIIYNINDKKVTVLIIAVKPRGNVYNNY